MKSLIVSMVVVVLVAATSFYIGLGEYNYKIDTEGESDEDDEYQFDLSMSKLVEEEIHKLEMAQHIERLDREREIAEQKKIEEKKAIEQAEKLKKEQELADSKAKQDKAKRTKREIASRGEVKGTFTATAYDLSFQSCGKYPDHPKYGETASGKFISGMTREEAMSIAVDPTVIPLMSKVYVEFPAPYEHFTGTYTARDTGGAIKGNIIDIYMGDFGKVETDQSVWDFGRRKVKVTVLE